MEGFEPVKEIKKKGWLEQAKGKVERIFYTRTKRVFQERRKWSPESNASERSRERKTGKCLLGLLNWRLLLTLSRELVSVE